MALSRHPGLFKRLTDYLLQLGFTPSKANTLSNRCFLSRIWALCIILSIQVLRQPTSLVLSQQKYLEDLLRETNMLTSKPCATPMPTAPTLSKAMGSPHPHPEHYCQVLGSLQYLTLTRPDIAFSVNKLAQFMHSPTDIHW
ncbi:hypothetical protein GH714_008902 [Hevea brasiliensis]|uniref:Reverse transcriptase Ty1/copia-type domain-containing protein n=1 Tax=Hevea brasiliensis TaxID=3981 RepID=A0A6A6LZW9_HEVBR|nr:hypothetical protein GH714_008902 [Hevea brasiliensis]